MTQQQNTQRVTPAPASGEIITLPPVKVRTSKPAWARKTRAVAERIVPALLGLGLLLIVWELAAINSKGFPKIGRAHV